MGTYPLPKKVSRLNYENLILRAQCLRTLGIIAERIIDEFLTSDIAKRPIKGLSPHQLEQHTMKYADRLFHAEKRIIKVAHPDEWMRDDRLKCINAAMLLQDKGVNRNYTIGLKPGKFIVGLGSIKIEAEYVQDQIIDCTRIIQLWTKSEPKPEPSREPTPESCREPAPESGHEPTSES